MSYNFSIKLIPILLIILLIIIGLILFNLRCKKLEKFENLNYDYYNKYIGPLIFYQKEHDNSIKQIGTYPNNNFDNFEKKNIKKTSEIILPKGEIGNTGLQGNRGSRGERGQDGIQGIYTTGDLGLQGKQGKQGINGDSGNIIGKRPIGKKGEIGLMGKPGIPGIQGAPGIQGPRGIKGPKGIDSNVLGPSGNPGIKIGPPGPQGPQGIEGKKGEITSYRGPKGTVSEIVNNQLYINDDRYDTTRKLDVLNIGNKESNINFDLDKSLNIKKSTGYLCINDDIKETCINAIDIMKLSKFYSIKIIHIKEEDTEDNILELDKILGDMIENSKIMFPNSIEEIKILIDTDLNRNNGKIYNKGALNINLDIIKRHYSNLNKLNIYIHKYIIGKHGEGDSGSIASGINGGNGGNGGNGEAAIFITSNNNNKNFRLIFNEIPGKIKGGYGNNGGKGGNYGSNVPGETQINGTSGSDSPPITVNEYINWIPKKGEIGDNIDGVDITSNYKGNPGLGGEHGYNGFKLKTNNIEHSTRMNINDLNKTIINIQEITKIPDKILFLEL